MAIGIIIQLDEEQQEALKPIMDKIAQMAAEGKPGMAVAQLFGDHMACGWLPHEKAKRMSEESGCRVIKTAYDRT